MTDVSQEVQREITRIRDMIITSKVLLPKANVNFAIYEATIAEARRAIREQDATALVKLLPKLREMH